MKWSCFAGLSQEKMVCHFREALTSAGIPYDEAYLDRAGLQAFMLGSSERIWQASVMIQKPDQNPNVFHVRVLSASMDPLSRLWSRVLTGHAERPGTKEVSVVELGPIRSENAQGMRKIMHHVISAAERPPWQLDHHPRFAVSPLLAWQVRRRWDAWQYAGSILS